MFKIIDVYKDESSYVAIEPVSLAEAKAWLLINFTDDDNLLLALISYARKSIEDFCNISIVPKTIYLTCQVPARADRNASWMGVSKWDLGFYGFPADNEDGWSELPYGPVTAVQAITTIAQDSTGTITNLTANTDYYVRGVGFKQVKINTISPNVLIQYFTPYYCPLGLKDAILNEIAFRYKNRGDNVNRYASQNVGASEGAQYLAFPYKRIWE